MNRKNKILVGCLALLLVLSVGYAIFSDTITINGTATAKGSFDITATCEPGIPSKLGTAESLGLNADGGYENDICSVVDDEVSLEANFLYPGASRNFTVKLTNTGSIDAVYDDSQRTSTEELCVADDMEGNNLSCSSSPESWGGIELKGYIANMSYTPLAMEDASGNLLSESELLEYYDPSNGIATLKPGYSVYLNYYIFIEHSNDTMPAGEMFVDYNATFTMPIEQATTN